MNIPRFGAALIRGATLGQALDYWGVERPFPRLDREEESQSLSAKLRRTIDWVRSKTHGHLTKAEYLEYQRRLKLIGLLKDYVLLGFGYALPRSPDALPELIPPDVWSGDIDWEESTVRGSGREFVSVRLIPLWGESLGAPAGFTQRDIDDQVQQRTAEVLSEFIPTNSSTVLSTAEGNSSKAEPNKTGPSNSRRLENSPTFQEFCALIKKLTEERSLYADSEIKIVHKTCLERVSKPSRLASKLSKMEDKTFWRWLTRARENITH